MNGALGGEQPRDEIVDRVDPCHLKAVVAVCLLAFHSSEFCYHVQEDKNHRNAEQNKERPSQFFKSVELVIQDSNV